MKKSTTTDAMTAIEAVQRGFFLTRDPRSRASVPIAMIEPQRALLAAFDDVDAVTGLPRYAELAYLSIKKSGKDTALALMGLASLIGDPFEHEPRDIAVVSGSQDQSRSTCFVQVCQFCRAHPWLSKHVRELKNELVYTEGGTVKREHVLRAIPAGNPSGLHGRNFNLTIFTETWLMNYELLEALAPSPARRAPRMIHGSYAGLKSQAHAGNVLWDLWQRWKAGDDRLFVSYLGGPDAWRQVPWISEKFIEGERRRLAHVPQRYTRLWENAWAQGDAGSFLTVQELHDAQDGQLSEAIGPVPGASAGLDLGLTKDGAAFMVTNVGADGKLTPQAIRIWRPTPGARVSLMAVEEEIATLVQRLGVRTLVADRWNAALMVERLRRRLPQLRIVEVTCDAANLDRWATNLKTWFRDRHIRIPMHAGLLEELESLEAEELRRKDRVRFTATGENHDDATMALCLSADTHGGIFKKARPSGIGRPVLAEMPEGCRIERFIGDQSGCVVLGGNYLPGQPACLMCEGRASLLQLHDEYLARGGALSVQVYRAQVADNAFILRRNMDNWLYSQGVI